MVKPLEKACGMELRTAGLIIGWLGVFGNVLYFCMAAVAVTLVKAIKEAEYESAENGKEARSHDQAEAAATVIGGILMGASILGAVISGLLIYGIKQIRHSMLLPWLVLGALGIVFSCYQLLLCLWDFVAGSHNFQVFLFQVFSTGLCGYIYYVIYSLYTHMKKGSGKGRVLTPPRAAAVPLQQTVPTANPPNVYPTNAEYPPNEYPTTYPTDNKV
ncbi:uncharacterized protein LOC132790958 [Drosophila nasuta]|uniref:uncharacterized protein LOC132790958 n=1 Tax=Drosophila nasuta TaxID=42062 RepID=UPI00295ECA04|nr:uncharacterized protein LOC132790958 [Drosophila nasuta]